MAQNRGYEGLVKFVEYASYCQFTPLKGVCPCSQERAVFRSLTRHLPEAPLTCKLAQGVCPLPVTIKAENLKKVAHVLLALALSCP